MHLHNLWLLEFRKMYRYRTFWILIALFLFSIYGITAGIDKFSLNMAGSPEGQAMMASEFNIYKFPDIWQNFTYLIGWVKVILALIIIISITNDYNYRTLRQHIIDGLSPTAYFLSKLLAIITYTLFSTLILAIFVMIYGESVPNAADSSFGNGIGYLLVHSCQVMGYLLIAALIAIVLKRSGLSIVIFLAYVFMIEPLAAFIIGIDSSYLPAGSFSELLAMPFKRYIGAPAEGFPATSQWLISIGYLLLLSFLSFLKLNKSDL